jgi:sortase (surface protein transpeptidase)
VTPSSIAGHRLDGRRIWLLVAVSAAVVAALFVALAMGLFTGSSPKAHVARPAPTKPVASAPPGAAAAAAPTDNRVAPMPRSVPTRLLIPRIGVDSTLMHLGLKADGSLETPPGAFPAGWFTGAPTPGQIGPAIIVGHVRYNTPGVFARLTDLRHGDRIDVRRKDGRTASFRVARLERFAKSAFPTKKVYGNIDHPGLRLITCGGLDARTNHYDENVVVFADLVAR